MLQGLLDTMLMDLGGAKWTIRNAVEGVQIFGGIGSGKTSGSGRTIALKYLAANFGGLVLTVKPDEKDTWIQYCREAGREKDLVIISPGSGNFFNFLEYESTSRDERKSLTENIVHLLKTVINASEEKSGGKSEDPFWENALNMLMYNVIDLCLMAYDRVSVQDMYDIVQALPRKDNPEAGDKADAAHKNAYHKAYDAARKKMFAQVEAYEGNLPEAEQIALKTLDAREYDFTITNAVPDARRFDFIYAFFEGSFRDLSDKTRSIIELSFSSFLFSLLHDPVFSLFCRHPSNITPDDCDKGKIILIDLPVKIYHKVGRDSQILIKYVWQRAMEKRKPMRPVFLFADEAQNFLHELDAECQATARSSLIATVYISQNLPNYYANMGGSKYEFKVKSFLGTLATKIFHANADIETNKYASELIGDALFEETSQTATAAGQFSSSETTALKIDRKVRPEDFVSLKTGGKMNEYKTEGYIHLQGYTGIKKQNCFKIAFNQEYKLHT